MDYDRSDFDHRHKLTSLRMDAIKQTITLALAIMAIPTAVAALKMLPDYKTSPRVSTIFWMFISLGILSAIVSLFSVILFLWRAPRWTRDTTINSSPYEALLDITYPTAAISMVIAAIFFIIAAFLAFWISQSYN